MMSLESIETKRLRGERVKESHLQFWHLMGSNSQVMKTLGGIWSPEKTKQKIQFNCEHWHKCGHGLWTFFDKTTNQFVGWGGIRKVMINQIEEVELAYALMPEFWGQELAVEMSKKSLAIAFNEFNYPSVVCLTLINNRKSQRVMEKLGFGYESNLDWANLPHVLYRYLNPNHN